MRCTEVAGWSFPVGQISGRDIGDRGRCGDMGDREGDHVLRDAPMNEQRMSLLEREFSIELNPEFRQFLLIYGAGDFLFSQFCSFDPDNAWSLWRQSAFVDGIGKSILSFSDNGCGDYYAFLIVDGRCSNRIYLLEQISSIASDCIASA